MFKNILIILLFLFFFISKSYSDIIKKITIEGNDRISDETIIMFSSISIDDFLDDRLLNNILKNLYESNFFTNVSVDFKNNNLLISVDENPLIENINYNGVESEKIRNILLQNLNLKSRSSFSELFLKKDKDLMLSNFTICSYCNWIKLCNNLQHALCHVLNFFLCSFVCTKVNKLQDVI